MQEKNNIISYKGYSAEIQFSSEDECLIGHILNINDIVGFHGNSVDEIKNAFAEAVDFYIKTNIDENADENVDENIDEITLNIPKELHKKLFLQAKTCGETLDKFILNTLNKYVTTMY